MDGVERELETSFEFWTGYGQLITRILNTYISGYWTICLISGKPGDAYPFVRAFSVFPYVSVMFNEGLNSTDNYLLAGIETGCNTFLVHQKAALDFLDLFVEVHDVASYRNPTKYVLLLEDADRDSDLLNVIRKHHSLTEILNVLILHPANEMATIELLTNKFVGSYELSSELYVLDRYVVGDGSFRFGNGLFPDKTVDLYGRPVRVATFNVNPHVFVKEAAATFPQIRSKNRMVSLDGLDGILMVDFCSKHNCSIEILDDEVNMWGVILPNRSGNGILGSLVERRADVGVGAISSWYHCYEFLDFSTPIQRGIVTCLVPKPHLLPRWKMLVMAFSTSVYLTIFGTFCSVISIYLMIAHFILHKNQQRSVIWNALNVLAVFLLQATNVRNRSASETITSLALLLFGLNLGSIYSGKYASLRTVSLHEPAIDTIIHLAKSDIPWLQAHAAWSISLLLSENPLIKKLVSNFEVLPPSELRLLADEGQSAFAVARLHRGHLMLGDWITAQNIHKYRLMKEELYYEYEIAMCTKTWPLVGAFNRLLGHMTSTQLLSAQEQRIIYQYNDYYVQRVALNSHKSKTEELKALGLEDILGGLFILGFGLLCAGVVFALEVLNLRKLNGRA